MTIEERIQLSVPLQTEEQLDYEVEKFVKIFKNQHGKTPLKSTEV